MLSPSPYQNPRCRFRAALLHCRKNAGISAAVKKSTADFARSLRTCPPSMRAARAALRADPCLFEGSADLSAAVVAGVPTYELSFLPDTSFWEAVENI